MNTTKDLNSLPSERSWALDYIGINWTPDFNCWDFAKWVLLDRLGIDAATAFDAIHNPLSIDDSGEAIANGLLGSWKEVSSPMPLHLCVMGKKDTLHHVGVVVDSDTIIHTNKGMPACCTSIEEIKTKFKTIKFYTYAKDHTG